MLMRMAVFCMFMGVFVTMFMAVRGLAVFVGVFTV